MVRRGGRRRRPLHELFLLCDCGVDFAVGQAGFNLVAGLHAACVFEELAIGIAAVAAEALVGRKVEICP